MSMMENRVEVAGEAAHPEVNWQVWHLGGRARPLAMSSRCGRIWFRTPRHHAWHAAAVLATFARLAHQGRSPRACPFPSSEGKDTHTHLAAAGCRRR